LRHEARPHDAAAASALAKGGGRELKVRGALQLLIERYGRRLLFEESGLRHEARPHDAADARALCAGGCQGVKGALQLLSTRKKIVSPRCFTNEHKELARVKLEIDAAAANALRAGGCQGVEG